MYFTSAVLDRFGYVDLVDNKQDVLLEPVELRDTQLSSVVQSTAVSVTAAHLPRHFGQCTDRRQTEDVLLQENSVGCGTGCM